MPDEVTPDGTAFDEGQGQSDNGLMPDLTAVPEQAREKVLSAFKDMESNFNRKFEEAANYRKTWEPYEALGINDVSPDELRDLLAFNQLAQDPAAFKQWYDAVGQDMGYSLGDESFEEEETPDVQSLIEAALAERLGPVEQTLQAQAQAQALHEAETFIDTKLAELAEKHGEFDQDAVCQLALAYDGEGAIEQGFADYQRLIGAAEQSVLSGKLKAPEPPAQGGRPTSQIPAITSFEDAKAAAAERMRQALST